MNYYVELNTSHYSIDANLEDASDGNYLMLGIVNIHLAVTHVLSLVAGNQRLSRTDTPITIPSITIIINIHPPIIRKVPNFFTQPPFYEFICIQQMDSL
jgi:hypothetical protein